MPPQRGKSYGTSKVGTFADPRKIGSLPKPKSPKDLEAEWSEVEGAIATVLRDAGYVVTARTLCSFDVHAGERTASMDVRVSDGTIKVWSGYWLSIDATELPLSNPALFDELLRVVTQYCSKS